MINRLSNLINCNRSAAKISQVLCSNNNRPETYEKLTWNLEKPQKTSLEPSKLTWNCTGWLLEHKTCDILAAERLRLIRFDNRLIIDSFLHVYSNGNFP